MVKIPRHLAIIMDGNGRWATAQGLPRVKGHEAGADSVREITRACRRMGVEALTLYSFSTENWTRPASEVAALMALLKRYLVSERREILDNGIRFQAIGQVDRLPIYVRKPLELLARESDVPGARMTLTLALSYGGRAEILDAVRSIATDVQRRKLRVEDIDEALFSARLGTTGLPDPDLLVRTSGEQRISNFLLWQIAYAEIYITPVAWPEFREPQLIEAFEDFARRERRFGKTSAQVSSEEGS
ncbi:MAG: di-trans,poly-cis-decaprenylcistransferase [Alphaproteobacteria bacterium]|nr:di-trans,poly-cis-decaprenylcistransferase [Alphaproteobacteria bacterium]MCB9792555.1 di-trans,poly-cis-decaprenylcistransferase [Alphaproteobacteria bacterium]